MKQLNLTAKAPVLPKVNIATVAEKFLLHRKLFLHSDMITNMKPPKNPPAPKKANSENTAQTAAALKNLVRSMLSVTNGEIGKP